VRRRPVRHLSLAQRCRGGTRRIGLRAGAADRRQSRRGAARPRARPPPPPLWAPAQAGRAAPPVDAAWPRRRPVDVPRRVDAGLGRGGAALGASDRAEERAMNKRDLRTAAIAVGLLLACGALWVWTSSDARTRREKVLAKVPAFPERGQREGVRHS